MRSTTPGTSRALSLLAAFVAASLVTGALLAGLFIPAVGATGAVTRSSVDYFNSLPADLSRPPLAEQSTMYAADGRTVIARFYDENRITVPLSRITPLMRKAIVAIEDSRFYEHGGVDPRGIVRAFINNQVSGDVQGASTLTQQYIKNYNVEKCVASDDRQCYLDAVAQSPARKLREMRIAIALEQQLKKDQILEGYLNIANFGDNTFGVEAASEYYFNVPASKLSLVQAATLAGLVQAPATYSPFQHPKAATTRRNEVLNRMLELKMISQQDLTKAMATPLKTTRHIPRNGCVTAGNAAYFCEYVIRTLQTDPAYAWLGKTEAQRLTTIKRAGLKIVTTLNPRVQQTASATVVKHIPVRDSSHVAAAAVTVEPGTGKVLAMAQNRIYLSDGKPGNTMINYSVDRTLGGSAGFATGSTFKPYTLATYLSEGKSLNDIVDGTKTSRPYTDFEACGSKLHGTKPYTFNNAGDGNERAMMPVQQATYDSVNTAFVDIESRVDLCDLAKVAGKLGVHLASPKQDCYQDKPATVALPTCLPSMTLGPLSISPLTMATAYAAFAADGKFCQARPVSAIMNKSGARQKVAGLACSQAISDDVAHGVTYALKKVLTQGTGSGLGISRPAAGKTGTSDQSANTWFVGYTPYLSTAVWVADPATYTRYAATSHQKPLHNIKINGKTYGVVYGATIAGAIWRDLMRGAVKGTPSQDWPNPPSSMLKGSGVRVPDVPGHVGGAGQRAADRVRFQGVDRRDRPRSGAGRHRGVHIALRRLDGSVRQFDHHQHQRRHPGRPRWRWRRRWRRRRRWWRWRRYRHGRHHHPPADHHRIARIRRPR